MTIRWCLCRQLPGPAVERVALGVRVDIGVDGATGAVVCRKRRVPVADSARHGGAGSKEVDDALVVPFALA